MDLIFSAWTALGTSITTGVTHILEYDWTIITWVGWGIMFLTILREKHLRNMSRYKNKLTIDVRDFLKKVQTNHGGIIKKGDELYNEALAILQANPAVSESFIAMFQEDHYLLRWGRCRPGLFLDTIRIVFLENLIMQLGWINQSPRKIFKRE